MIYGGGSNVNSDSAATEIKQRVQQLLLYRPHDDRLFGYRVIERTFKTITNWEYEKRIV